jgi:zinc protease
MITGRSSRADIETLMQMMWLTFTSPRFDEDAARRTHRQYETTLRNQHNSPQHALVNRAIRTLFDDHLRALSAQTMTLDELMQVNHRVGYDFFRSRFNSASGFDFVFVGDIDKDRLHRFIEIYIANLPSARVDTRIIDRGFRLNQTATTEVMHLGDQVTIKAYMFASDFPFNLYEDRRLDAATDVLNLLLFEYVREQIGGVYVVHGHGQTLMKPFPQSFIQIILFCDKERAEEIETAVFDVIRMLQENTFEDRFLDSYKETTLLNRQRRIITNQFWLNLINESVLYFGYDVAELLAREEFVNNLTREDIVKTINKYLDMDNMLKVVLFPEEEESAE